MDSESDEFLARPVLTRKGWPVGGASDPDPSMYTGQRDRRRRSHVGKPEPVILQGRVTPESRSKANRVSRTQLVARRVPGRRLIELDQVDADGCPTWLAPRCSGEIGPPAALVCGALELTKVQPQRSFGPTGTTGLSRCAPCTKRCSPSQPGTSWNPEPGVGASWPGTRRRGRRTARLPRRRYSRANRGGTGRNESITVARCGSSTDISSPAST